MLMKRITLLKLIVISQSESKSLEVPFSEGLNIILGGNKTGKSSIIKSIFIAFGCECKHIEKSWKDLITEYILLFRCGGVQYCILRRGARFCIYSVKGESYCCLIDTRKFQEYSNYLMSLLDVNMPCVDKNSGAQFNITPPLLFRFQYIDQDDGWTKIADSFTRVSYIKNWRGNTNKYVCGYLDDDYYELKAEKDGYLIAKEDKNKELQNNRKFVDHISITLFSMSSPKTIEEIQNDIAASFDDMSTFQKDRVSLRAQISDLENQAYINKQRLIVVERNLKELGKDIHFAMQQEEELVCPTCGAIYSNEFPAQLNISSDYAHCEKLKLELKDRLRDLGGKLKILKEKDKELVRKIRFTERDIEKSQENLSYSLFYKNKGHLEVYDECQKQLKLLQSELENIIGQIAILDHKIESKKSPSRSREIKELIMEKCREIATMINIPESFIKFRDFVQVIEHTGSETPRLVYMYQTALYLYNLERNAGPFSFYVIDTPNQQGQDEDNLVGVFKSLKLLLPTDGQVIVGTERKTGLENDASNVIRLIEKRQCLNTVHYTEHIQLLEQLQKAPMYNVN